MTIERKTVIIMQCMSTDKSMAALYRVLDCKGAMESEEVYTYINSDYSDIAYRRGHSRNKVY